MGGGTPHVRLSFNGSTTVILGKIGDDGHNWGLYDAASGISSTTGISGNNTLRMVIVRFDYSNNTMRMYIDPNLSTFDYSNPSGHDAEISGISIPYFDEIGPMFRITVLLVLMKFMFLKNHLKLSQMVVETASGVRLQTGIQEVYLHQVPTLQYHLGKQLKLEHH